MERVLQVSCGCYYRGGRGKPLRKQLLHEVASIPMTKAREISKMIGVVKASLEEARTSKPVSCKNNGLATFVINQECSVEFWCDPLSLVFQCGLNVSCDEQSGSVARKHARDLGWCGRNGCLRV
jgi:hypothetical protein